MTFASRKSALMFIGFALIGAAAAGAWFWNRVSGPLVLDAPPPRIAADPVDTLPAVPASTIEALVTYNMRTAVDSLEHVVPRTYGSIDDKLAVASNTRASFAYAVSRSPFRAHVVGQVLTLSADIDYEGRVWYRPPVGPELSAGCGVGNAPRPRVRATLVSAARLTPDWQLRTDTHVLRLEPYSDGPCDRCRLTVLRIDVTQRVMAATRQMLERHLRLFDRAVSRWAVRPKFEKLWAQVQRPIRLADDVYLEINPYAAQIGAVSAVDDTVMARLQLIASPRVVTGARPRGSRPLPPLSVPTDIGPGAHVAIEGTFTYPVATALLRRALIGREIVQQGHRIRIRDVRLSGIGGGRVALGVTLSGGIMGKLYFTGTPSLDPQNRQVSVPDLDYDVGTAQMLVESFAWLRGVDIRNFLRERARLPDSAAIGRLRGIAENGINRTLAPGVTLRGRIHDARATDVRATRRDLRLRAVAVAEFTLAIDRAPAFPKMRRHPMHPAPASQPTDSAGGSSLARAAAGEVLR
jgi:hypothetical protein